MTLTPSQLAAVTRTGQDVCVIAGPGSGKTRVLTERFAWLVETMDVSPRSILAITFTNKAAAEIRDRVTRRVTHHEIHQAPISTLHAFCIRVLKEFSLAAGLDPTIELWDERLAQAELHSSVEEVLNTAAQSEVLALRQLFTSWCVREPSRELASLYNQIASLSGDIPDPLPPTDPASWLLQLDSLAAQVLAAPAVKPKSAEFRSNFADWFALLPREPGWPLLAHLGRIPGRASLTKELQVASKAFCETAAEAATAIVSFLTRQESHYLHTLLQRIAETYSARKHAAARMDFHDVEHFTIRLLETQPAIRTLLQNRYEHILMDEMQDTNPVQWRLLDLLRTPGGFFAVGDINQSIYGFRHGAPELFAAYRSRVGNFDTLAENFRSRAEILAYTESVLRGEEGMEDPQFQAARKFVTSNRPVVVANFDRASEESAWLAAEIQSLYGSFVVEDKQTGQLRRAAYRDIAILVRKMNAMETIAAALSTAGIPTRLSGGRAFFDRQEVIDLLNYLSYLANPLDRIVEAAVFRSPLASLSDHHLLAGHRNATFDAFVSSQRQDLDFTPPDLLVSRALDHSGYPLSPNVEKLLAILRTEWQRGARNLRAFMDDMEAMRSAAAEKTADETEREDAVSLFTVHAAKGLEFPIVFVAQSRFVSNNKSDSLRFHPKAGVGICWTNPTSGKTAKDAVYAAIDAHAKSQEEKEERRLLFVALTRAEQKLYVSWDGDRRNGWLKQLKDKPAPPLSDGPDPLGPIAPLDAHESRPALLLSPLPPQPHAFSSSTPTDLAKFAHCPRQFFLDSLAGLSRLPRAGPPRALSLGTDLHDFLAGLSVDSPDPEVLALAEVFTRSPLGQRAARASRLEREFDFVLALGDLVLEGQMDLWFLEANEAVIVDYKTDRSSTHASYYFPQLAVYKEVLRRLLPATPVRAYLHFLRPDEVIEVTNNLDPAFLERFRTADSFPPQPGVHCLRCPHLEAACPISRYEVPNRNDSIE